MYATGIDLSEMKRVQIIELCNECLAEAVDLQLHCKHAHWNVKGRTSSRCISSSIK